MKRLINLRSGSLGMLRNGQNNMSRVGNVQQEWVKSMKKYRIYGTFSYWPEGASDESLKTIDTTVVVTTREEAITKPLEDYEHEEQEPAWLFGYPAVEFLEDVYTGPPLRDYWTK